MTRAIRKTLTVATVACVLVALAPAPSAHAHKTLPKGTYNWYYWGGWPPQLVYGYEWLKLRAGNKYTWDDAGTQYTGEYRHSKLAGKKRVIFQTGKLSKMDVVGIHNIEESTGAQRIILRWDTGGGTHVDQWMYLATT